MSLSVQLHLYTKMTPNHESSFSKSIPRVVKSTNSVSLNFMQQFLNTWDPLIWSERTILLKLVQLSSNNMTTTTMKRSVLMSSSLCSKTTIIVDCGWNVSGLQLNHLKNSKKKCLITSLERKLNNSKQSKKKDSNSRLQMLGLKFVIKWVP